MITEQYEYDDTWYNIKIGQTAQENWDIIDDAEQNDIWFHIDNHSSCHVILETENSTKIPKAVLNYCAALCKNNTKKCRNMRNINVIYTEKKNISKGREVGSVHTKKTKTIKV